MSARFPVNLQRMAASAHLRNGYLDSYLDQPKPETTRPETIWCRFCQIKCSTKVKEGETFSESYRHLVLKQHTPKEGEEN